MSLLAMLIFGAKFMEQKTGDMDLISVVNRNAVVIAVCS